MPKMKPHPKRLILEIFREGHGQCQYYLASADGTCFCGEGLVCEAYRRDTGKGHWKKLSNRDMQAFCLPGEAWSTAAPLTVWRWAGLQSRPYLMYEGNAFTIPQLSDRGVPFTVIADLIEAQL